ncbi:N-acetylglutamate synthase, mitochondrial [Octopus bimaculoides]|uniref:N-acetyltransferase domain-containing protein n=1 Tax=Octopus bimaculoides TaxID=37653 RepID=A0A0L8HKT9_OCTBM|nr:N-acetylglutamate synthase, mitochondrial [Octopus bimaculoides]XP_052830156.1 N-acetylglutamate synthase, mitochondrial [Octopus bimaculoides]XP_052830157.1 N-acetylglutamate synthase, mitochondrial [Octopus bimaculoides]|eukprot:XP_014771495.1 PREDICTED: N-acetylglutamate synthase, mitochondrial-like [Octopus bimaculoides]
MQAVVPKCNGHTVFTQCVRCAHTLTKNVQVVSSKELQQLMQAVQNLYSHNYCTSCCKMLSPKLNLHRNTRLSESHQLPLLLPIANFFNFRCSSTTKPYWKDVVRSVQAATVKMKKMQEPGYYPVTNREMNTDLRRFLSEVGTDPKEARYWLKQFVIGESIRPFAVVQVDPEVFCEKAQLEAFASCISFLHRNSMRPVVILGTDFNENETMKTEDFKISRAKMLGDCIILTSMLELFGTNTRPFFSGSNIVEAVQSSSNSVFGKVSAINSDPIKWCLHSKHVPIIPAVGETPSGQILAVDLWNVTEEISKALQPLKVMKINLKGGFLDEEGHVIPNINLPVDLETVAEKPWYTPEIKSRISRISDLLYQLPSHSSVVITSVDKMLQELFTHRGSGTFFKITEPIHRYHHLEQVDQTRLHNLLLKAFGRNLKDGYFEMIQNQLHTLYLSEDYSAAAIILHENSTDVPYLDKFAVSQKAQGEGTGEMLWACVRQDFKQLFWRSRGDNPINPWYFKKSEGSWSNGKWTVFWYGIQYHNTSSLLIDVALEKESSFTS